MHEVLSQVAGVVEATEGMSVRVDWFGNVIGKIVKVKDHQKLEHNGDLIMERMEDLKRQLNILAYKLMQTEDVIAE